MLGWQLVFKVYWAGILIFLGRGTPSQLTISITSVLVMLLLLSMLQPYRSGYDNMLWTAGLGKVLFTTWPAGAAVVTCTPLCLPSSRARPRSWEAPCYSTASCADRPPPAGSVN